MSETSDQQPTPADDSALRDAQQAIDEAKAAAAEVDHSGEDDLIDEDAPVADDAAPSSGPAPAA